MQEFFSNIAGFPVVDQKEQFVNLCATVLTRNYRNYGWYAYADTPQTHAAVLPQPREGYLDDPRVADIIGIGGDEDAPEYALVWCDFQPENCLPSSDAIGYLFRAAGAQETEAFELTMLMTNAAVIAPELADSFDLYPLVVFSQQDFRELYDSPIWEWAVVAPAWKRIYELTLSFAAEFGCLPGKQTKRAGIPIGRWIRLNRRAYQNKPETYPVACVEKLEALPGWTW